MWKKSCSLRIPVETFADGLNVALEAVISGGNWVGVILRAGGTEAAGNTARGETIAKATDIHRQHYSYACKLTLTLTSHPYILWMVAADSRASGALSEVRLIASAPNIIQKDRASANTKMGIAKSYCGCKSSSKYWSPHKFTSTYLCLLTFSRVS